MGVTWVIRDVEPHVRDFIEAQAEVEKITVAEFFSRRVATWSAPGSRPVRTLNQEWADMALTVLRGLPEDARTQLRSLWWVGAGTFGSCFLSQPNEAHFDRLMREVAEEIGLGAPPPDAVVPL